MGKYFARFPTINYNGSFVKNITARVNLLPSVQKEGRAFYPYTMRTGDRADTIAYDYYSDAFLDYQVYFSNNITDPYYDVPLNQTDLDSYIVKKYGSTEIAQDKIIYWENDWASDDSILTVAGYESIPDVLKKYWTANPDQYDNVISYVRKHEDWSINTNMVMSFSVNTNATFITGEKIKQGSNNATLSFANSSVLIVQDVQGIFTANQSITSSQSNNNLTLISTSVITTALDPLELNYYIPVDAYTHEVKLNEKKKEIVLLDKKFSSLADSDLKKLLSS